MKLQADTYEEQGVRAPYNATPSMFAQSVLMSANVTFMEFDVPHLTLGQFEQVWFIQSRACCLYKGSITSGRVSLGLDWVLKDLHPKLDFQGFDCSDLLSGFTRCVNWTEKHLQISLFPDLPKPHVVALTRYGFKGKTAGVRARALLPHQDQIDIVHIVTNTCVAKNTSNNPSPN